MGDSLIAPGTLPKFRYEAHAFVAERLHRIEVTGPISLVERGALYEQTLALTETHRYFCVLNNMGRHENKFSLDDMRYLDSIMIDSGITEFYGVTISHDPAYTGIVELASASAQSLALKNDLWTTPDPIEAELFIMRQLAQAQAGN
jgi:hypothetical protein